MFQLPSDNDIVGGGGEKWLFVLIQDVDLRFEREKLTTKINDDGGIGHRQLAMINLESERRHQQCKSSYATGAA